MADCATNGKLGRLETLPQHSTEHHALVAWRARGAQALSALSACTEVTGKQLRYLIASISGLLQNKARC